MNSQPKQDYRRVLVALAIAAIVVSASITFDLSYLARSSPTTLTTTKTTVVTSTQGNSKTSTLALTSTKTVTAAVTSTTVASAAAVKAETVLVAITNSTCTGFNEICQDIFHPTSTTVVVGVNNTIAFLDQGRGLGIVKLQSVSWPAGAEGLAHNFFYGQNYTVTLNASGVYRVADAEHPTQGNITILVVSGTT